MPSGLSRDSASPVFRFWDCGLIVLCLIVMLGPLWLKPLWYKFWNDHPGQAPTTTYAMVDVPGMAQAILPMSDGFRRLDCTPHGRNPSQGWTCAVTLDSLPAPMTVEVNGLPLESDEPLYRAGLRFVVTQGPSVPLQNSTLTVASSFHVAVAVDPHAASLATTAQTIQGISMKAQHAVGVELSHQAYLRQQALDAARDAAEARKSPAQHAQENLSSWSGQAPTIASDATAPESHR